MTYQGEAVPVNPFDQRMGNPVDTIGNNGPPADVHAVFSQHPRRDVAALVQPKASRALVADGEDAGFHVKFQFRPLCLCAAT